MPRLLFLSALFALALCGASAAPAAETAMTNTIGPQAWSAYKSRFLDESGRIVDDANGNISHSEGQGYGLLLATLSGDLPAFEAIWTFTRTQMLLRDDGLAAWKWDPSRTPHVIDINNATDGDILIAYALARAAQRWHRDDFRSAASAMVRALGQHVLVQSGGRRLLLPAAKGFAATERPDGPVVNLSYWIFEAFPVFARLDPDDSWSGLARDGGILIANTEFSARNLPPDWLSLHGAPHPAAGFAPEFGYNAIRIPLYLIRGGMGDEATLKRFLAGAGNGAGDLVTADLKTGQVVDTLSDPGYRAVLALVACVADHTPMPADLRTFTPTQYYPSTLHLLVLATLAEQHLSCGAS